MNATPHRRALRIGSALVALTLIAAACGDDDDDGDTTAAPTSQSSATSATSAASTPTDTSGTGSSTTTADTTGDGGIDEERCATNKAAGKITYLSSFDFAAAASIIEVVVAKEKGYFDELCLDVELVPSFSTANYSLVAAGQGQFSSAGNYTEILNFTTGGAEFVALTADGKAPIEALITPEGGATTIEELQGKTVGVKGDLPPSIVALLASHGLPRGSGYSEVLLDGFDPRAHLELDIDALPVYKSNEPGQLDAAGVKYTMFDPAAEDIPGTFGLIYTAKDFYDENPTVVEDFVRAALRGLEDAIADPEGAVELSIGLIEAAGNQNFLTLEGETFRWQQEMEAMLASTPDGEPVGLIDGDVFRAEYDAYVEANVWPDGAPEFREYYDDTVAAAAYGDDGKVIWPAAR